MMRREKETSFGDGLARKKKKKKKKQRWVHDEAAG